MKFSLSFRLNPLHLIAVLIALAAMPALAANNATPVTVPLHRSTLVTLPETAGDVTVADADIAEVTARGGKQLTVSGKALGQTNVRVTGKDGKVMRNFLVTVGSDLPAVRKALNDLLPNEKIGIETLGSGIALTGNVSSASAADKAVKIASEFLSTDGGKGQIVNLMQVTSGQQVMLRVRVGEIQRSSFKELGIDLKALEDKGLFKVLAEPNLVAISGEEADFLAGGEIPIPVPQGGGTSAVEYKPYGVAVKFTPNVISENRIRLEVKSEVSQITPGANTQMGSYSVPSIETRRARTTVELAPGESFMVAGLMKDMSRANIEQIPGLADLPVIGAIFRSSKFQQNETELVIAVTPYIVDPMKSADVKLPTDDFRPASSMEMFFFGALGSMSGNTDGARASGLEGPVGFMVE